MPLHDSITTRKGRQEALVEAARGELAGRLEVPPSPAGMHLVGWLQDAEDDLAASRAAADAGLTAAALSPYATEHRPRPGLILGYAGFPENELRAAVEQLARALGRTVLE